MAKMIAFGKSTICSFKSNKRLTSWSHSCFSSFLRFWNICRTKVSEVPGEGRDLLLQNQTQNGTAHWRDPQRNVICSTVSRAARVQSCLLAHQIPLPLDPSLLREKKGIQLKIHAKILENTNLSQFLLCRDFTVKRAEGPNRSERVEVLLCQPKGFMEAKPGLLLNFFLYAVN